MEKNPQLRVLAVAAVAAAIAQSKFKGDLDNENIAILQYY